MKHVYKILLNLVLAIVLGFISMVLGAIGIVGFLNDEEKKREGFARDYVKTTSETLGL